MRHLCAADAFVVRAEPHKGVHVCAARRGHDVLKLAPLRCVVMACASHAACGHTKVTETQSLTLVKNLIRVSISTVCSLRGIFPQGCFQERTYGERAAHRLFCRFTRTTPLTTVKACSSLRLWTQTTHPRLDRIVSAFGAAEDLRGPFIDRCRRSFPFSIIGATRALPLASHRWQRHGQEVWRVNCFSQCETRRTCTTFASPQQGSLTLWARARFSSGYGAAGRDC